MEKCIENFYFFILNIYYLVCKTLMIMEILILKPTYKNEAKKLTFKI